jgi:hypothetical protein
MLSLGMEGVSGPETHRMSSTYTFVLVLLNFYTCSAPVALPNVAGTTRVSQKGNQAREHNHNSHLISKPTVMLRTNCHNCGANSTNTDSHTPGLLTWFYISPSTLRSSGLYQPPADAPSP